MEPKYSYSVTTQLYNRERSLHTIRNDVVFARMKRVVISLDCHATFISQKVVAIEDTEYLHHRIEVDVGNTIGED
jgi:hypothetical protein